MSRAPHAAVLAFVAAWTLGCGSGDAPAIYSVGYRLDGALSGGRAIVEVDDGSTKSLADPPSAEAQLGIADGFGAPRIGCSAVQVSDRDPAQGMELVISAVESYGETHGSGIYLKIPAFTGAGRYALDTANAGRAWVFDDAHVQACSREGDRSCYQGGDGCTVVVDRWDFGPGVVAPIPGLPSGVHVGLAEGRFSCGTLVNETTGRTVRIAEGTFKCRATDWSAVGG